MTPITGPAFPYNTGNLENLANIQTQNSHMCRFNLPSSSLKNKLISQSLGVLREQ